MKFTLTQTSVNLLHQVLNKQGWCEPGLKDIYLGGKVMSELPPADGLLPTASKPEVTAFLAKTVEVELDDQGVQTITKAIRAWKGDVSPDFFRIMETLKIVP